MNKKDARTNATPSRSVFLSLSKETWHGKEDVPEVQKADYGWMEWRRRFLLQ